jgi:DNA-binding NarL/FixJ family response regulator
VEELIPAGIIEAQRLFAPFLSQLLSEAGFTVVTILESVAVDELGRTEPQLVVIDIDFVDDDPVTTIKLLHTVVPLATLCVYTGTVDEGFAQTLVRAGAHAVITKLASPQEIVEAIRAALSKGSYLDRRIATTQLGN